MNNATLSIPFHAAIEGRAIPQTNIAAIHLQPTHVGAKLGVITQIPAGTPLEICGEGYNERTVKIRWHGQFYFVFRADIPLSD